jgi:DNA-binding HxlR family transcriptional regulator
VSRTYGDRCGIARALDLVGERWALLVVRELILGPKRFTDLRAGLPRVGPDVLAARLRELESAGVLQRATLPPPAGARVYELTERGRALEPVLLALGRWGSSVAMPASDVFGADSVVLGMKTLWAGALQGVFELRLGEAVFSLRASGSVLEVERGAAADAEAVLETDPLTLARLLWHGLVLEEAVADGVARVEQGRAAVRRWLRAFPQPPSAGPQ